MYSQYLDPTSYTHRGSLSPQLGGSSDRTLITATTEQSTKDSRTPTRISAVSSTGLFSSSSSSGWTPVISVSAPEEANGEHVEGKELDVPPAVKEKKPPKSKTVSPHIPHVTIRPGSNTKAVLPPIPSGQKKSSL